MPKCKLLHSWSRVEEARQFLADAGVCSCYDIDPPPEAWEVSLSESRFWGMNVCPGARKRRPHYNSRYEMEWLECDNYESSEAKKDKG